MNPQLRDLAIQGAEAHAEAAGGFLLVRRLLQDPLDVLALELADGFAQVKVPPLPDFGKWGPVERKPMDAVRRKTAEQMALAWSLIPHVTQHDLADITDLEAFRKQQTESVLAAKLPK